MPKLSILLSALNAESTLPKALESLHRQTFTDWECLATDDGSTDRTRAILKEWQSKDSRFQLLTHDKSLGLTPSLIESSGMARGEFIARQDADDWSEPHRFTQQVTRLEQNPVLSVVGSHFAVHDSEGLYLDTVQSATTPSQARRLLRRRNPFAHGSLLFRRSAFDHVGGYRLFFRYAQDYDLLLRLNEKGDVVAEDAVLYHHRLSTAGIGRLKRDQQAAYATLAKTGAEWRKEGRSEEKLFSKFKEPLGLSSKEPIDPILLHLIKSDQREKAKERLTEWHPKELTMRIVKSGLALLLITPFVIRKNVYHLYRLWQLR